jgi:ribosomal protein L35AE/L33A
MQLAMRASRMLGKVVRFKTPSGAIRQGRVKEEHVLHGRVRYTVQTDFGEVFLYADQTEDLLPPGKGQQKKTP